jgi:hypothetical protein
VSIQSTIKTIEENNGDIGREKWEDKSIRLMRVVPVHNIKIYLEELGLYNDVPCSPPTSSRISGIQMGEIFKLG